MPESDPVVGSSPICCLASQAWLLTNIQGSHTNSTAATFQQAEASHFDQVLKVNLMGVVHTIKAVLPGMLNRNLGCIVVTGSIGAFMGMCSSQQWLLALLQCCGITCSWEWQH